MDCKKVAILGGARIPFARSMSNYTDVPNKELLSAAIKPLVEKYNLKEGQVGELVAGAVLKRSRDFSLAREAAIEAGVGFETPAVDIQHACGTSLQAAIYLAGKISCGVIESGIAAGCDTSSDIPIEFKKEFSNSLVKMAKAKSLPGRLGHLAGLINPANFLPKVPSVAEPRTKMSMGDHCELMVQEWGIPRDEQDELALNSHKNAAKAYDAGFYDDLVFEFKGLSKDNNLRPATTMEKMAKLKPAFERSDKGTLTAANSSPLTDGAAAVLLGSEEFAKENNLEVQAYLTHHETAAVDFVNKEGLLMAPAYAVPRMLKRAGMKLQDFDFYEIHEAFAGQVLCTLKAWESDEFCKNKVGVDGALGSIDRSKLNVNGSSVALGHPFAATGARILAQAAKHLKQNGGGKTLISICTAGGMGVTAIIEL
jgi:acetyl-CoA C-acetyltransferase